MSKKKEIKKMHDFPIYRNLTSFKPCFKRRGASNGEKENKRNRKRDRDINR